MFSPTRPWRPPLRAVASRKLEAQVDLRGREAMLRELVPNLFVAEQPLKYGGFEIGARMTAIRLDDGSLFIHSPIRLTPKLRRDLERAGPVKFVVAPNRFHHLFVADCLSAFPAAEAYCAPGLETKRRDLRFAGTLSDTALEGWAGQIDQIWFRGFPYLHEIVFRHQASRSLLVTDLLFNLTNRATRTAFTLEGGVHDPAVPRAFLRQMRKAEARESLEKILAWDFDRVIVAHGNIINTDGPKLVREAWKPLVR